MPTERILLVGVNHTSAPLAVREKMALTGGYEEPLQRLSTIPGCREYYLLSTCNRVELLLVAVPGAQLEDELVAALLGHFHWSIPNVTSKWSSRPVTATTSPADTTERVRPTA